MLSLSKLVALVVVVFAVFSGMRWLERVQNKRKNLRNSRARVYARRSADNARAQSRDREPRAEDAEALIACESCGTYVDAMELAGGVCESCRTDSAKSPEKRGFA
jgi:hypothetical protein